MIFLYENVIYLVDLASLQIEKVDLHMDAHFLSISADSRYGVFAGSDGGFYQIFMLDLQNGSVQQLTHTNSNKILPYMDIDGNTYYIDCGEFWSFKKLAWLSLLINHVQRFKTYTNEWGRLSWGETLVLDFLVASYKAFKDEYFAREFENHARWVLGNMDIERGLADYQGVSTYGWSATRFSYDRQSYMSEPVLTAMVATPMAEFVELCLHDAGLRNRFESIFSELVRVLPELGHAHDDEFVEYESDILSITEEGEGYYIHPKGSPYIRDGANTAFNRQNKMGTFLILLYNITGDGSYLDKAVRLGRVFKRHLIETDGMYEWYYAWGKRVTGWTAEENISINTPSFSGRVGYDKTYSAMEMEFVCGLYPYGVFDDTDIRKFIATYLSYDIRNELGPRQIVKIGSLLLQTQEGFEKEIVNKARGVDLLISVESRVPIQIPYMSLISGNSEGSRWSLRRMDASGVEEELFVEERDTLVHFSICKNKIYSIHKENDTDYSIRESDLALAPPGYFKGDVNGDGKIRYDDALLTLRIAVKLVRPTNDQRYAADMDDDGEVRSNDALLILNGLSGLAAPGKSVITGVEHKITVTLTDVCGSTGESAMAPLTVDNNDGLLAGDICVEYDAAALRAVDVLAGPGVSVASNVTVPGLVRISFVGSGNLSSKMLARIQFDVLADGVSSLKLKSVGFYSADALPLVSIGVGRGVDPLTAVPASTALLQNFPNPFNPDTWIPYRLSKDSDVSIRIYSAAGKLVRTLDIGYRPAGIYALQDRSAHWDGRNKHGETVTSGVYFYTIQAGEPTATRKMLMLE